MSGPEIRLWVASDRPDTDVFVRLIEEGDDELAINITEGMARARYRDGLDQEVALEPGVPTESRIVLPTLAD